MASRKLPSPLTILMAVIIMAAACTWLVPAGKYDTLTFNDSGSFTLSASTGDSMLPFSQATLNKLNIRIALEKFSSGAVKKPISVPGSYHALPQARQGLKEVLEAPIRGIYDAIDVVLFILVIGAFMHVFNESGTMEKALKVLSYRMRGHEAWLIIVLSFLFSFAGASYGMAEEAFVFYAVLVPVFIAAGYDLIVPVAVIFGGTQLGTLASFTNPFSTIIASDAAGISWTDGITERLVMFVITTAITIAYIVRYAQKVKKDPTRSLLYRNADMDMPAIKITDASLLLPAPLGFRTSALLWIFLATFLTMIAGVVWWGWWLKEMTALFLAASVLVAVLLRMKESLFIAQFVKGAESLLSVALIVGVARGVTIILNEGKISDSIVFYAAGAVSTMPPALFIVALLLLYMVFTLFISSSSGMAALTMPIMGSLAVIINVPGREIVNAYLFGMGIMGFITPTGLILPSLALVGVSIKAWWKFIWPLLLMLLAVCIACLLIGIALN